MTITSSILQRYHAQNGAVRPSRQVMAFREQASGNHLEADFDVLDIRTGGNVRIASSPRRQHQAPGFDRDPELFVVHRREPFFHIVSRFEHVHAAIVSGTGCALQISIGGGRDDD